MTYYPYERKLREECARAEIMWLVAFGQTKKSAKPGPPADSKKRTRYLELLKQGKSIAYIAKVMGVTKSGARSMISRIGYTSKGEPKW